MERLQARNRALTSLSPGSSGLRAVGFWRQVLLVSASLARKVSLSAVQTLDPHRCRPTSTSSDQTSDDPLTFHAAPHHRNRMWEPLYVWAVGRSSPEWPAAGPRRLDSAAQADTTLARAGRYEPNTKPVFVQRALVAYWWHPARKRGQ